MTRRIALHAALSLLGVACAAIAVPPAAHAQGGEVCESPPPSNGPVSLIILASGQRVQELAASVRDSRIVHRDAETVIFDDGRIITANVSAAGDRINDLGWGARRLDVVATLPAKRARPRRSFG